MSKFWSFPKAPKNTLEDSTSKFNNIGPGSYQPRVNGIKKNEPAWSFSKEKRGKLKTNGVPGPGSYNSKGHPKKTEASITMTKRMVDKDENFVPGPGTYQPGMSNFKSVPKFTFSGKTQNNFGSNKHTPAPGFYEPNVDAIKTNTACIGFSKAKRSKKEKEDKIGPGSYNIKGEEMKVGGYMSMLRKGVVDKYDKVPGPGAYEMNYSTVDMGTNKAAIMRSGYKSTKYMNDVPGPGQYNPSYNVTKKRPNSCKFGLERKLKYNTTDVPGVGTYNPKSEFTKKGFGSVKFGKEKFHAPVKNNGVPGPGNYDFIEDIGKGASKLSFGGRAKLKIRNTNPGPGQYDPKIDFTSKVKKTRASSAMPRQKRFQTDLRNDSPGPGNYNINKADRKGNVVFGKNPKLKLDSTKSFVPGPGSYKFENHFEEGLKKGRGVSMKGKEKEPRPSTNVPGPGQYNSNYESLKKNESKISFGRNQRFKVKDETGCKVDPGAYNPDKIRPKSGVVFGKNARFTDEFKKANSPAPGHYNPIKPEKNIAFTIRPKTALAISNENPGPGTYNPNVKSVKKTETGVQFGKAKRSHQKKNKKELGPGQYNVRGNMNGVSHSFGKQMKGFKAKKEGPGPGNYNITSDLSDIPSYIKSTLKGRLAI